jgi:type I restriction enzyme M protein
MTVPTLYAITSEQLRINELLEESGGELTPEIEEALTLNEENFLVKSDGYIESIARFKALDKEVDRKRTEQSFFVPKAEIVDNAYDLSVNKYKETEYVAEEYPPTAELLAEIEELESQFQAELKTLKGLLGNE